MSETLDELLKHFAYRSCINYLYITNLTDDIEDKYYLCEIDNYRHYKVIEWKYILYNNIMFVTIEKW